MRTRRVLRCRMGLHPNPAAATRTTRRRLRCRRPPPGGRRPASPTAAADSAEDLVPGDANRALSFQIVQAPVELLALSFGERDCLGRGSQAVPELLEQTEPLLWRQCCDVEFRLAHAKSITSSRLGKSHVSLSVLRFLAKAEEWIRRIITRPVSRGRN